jgi:hypothetical protein
MKPLTRFTRTGLLLAACALVAPSLARADIEVQAWVRLITSGYCKVKRTVDTNGHTRVEYEKLDCSVQPEQSSNSYYFQTRLEGNLIEQIVDAAQFGKALYDFASNVAAAVGTGGASAALSGAQAANDVRTAYQEFGQLMDGWGGKGKTTQDEFVVSSPNREYRWVEILLSADSDDDPFERSVLAPAAPLPGVAIETITDTNQAKLHKVTIDLSQLPPVQRLTIPVGLAVSEGDCSASCLRISKVVNLIVERPEDGDIVASTRIGYSRRDADCDVCGFARRDLLLHNRIDPAGSSSDETVQQTTVSVRQTANGQYLVRNRETSEPFDQVYVGLEVDSARVRDEESPRIELAADCVGGCPAGVVAHVDGLASYSDEKAERQGRGTAYLTFDPRALPTGTTTLVLTASFEAGRGGTIAQHVVRLVKEIAVGVDPKVRSLPTAAATADGGGARVSAAPKPLARMQISGKGEARAALPDISGRWNSNIGLVYEISQQGGDFRWSVASLGQSATGTLSGASIAASWSDKNGKGSGRGTVTAKDAAGRATRIEWENGVVFTRFASARD